MKKLFLAAVVVSILFLGFLMAKSSWTFSYYSYQYTAPRLKAYAACVVQPRTASAVFGVSANETEAVTTTVAAPAGENYQGSIL
jgi:hypothetical protein